MREKIRDLDIRLTELADYLKISRSSLYNYIEYYEANNKKSVPNGILNLFKYIDKTKNLSKEMVINYIMTHFCVVEGRTVKDGIILVLNSIEEDNIKLAFIDKLINSDVMDSVIPYLTKCLELSEKEEYSQSDIIQLAKYVNFKNDIETNSVPSPEEIELTKKTLER